MKKLFKRLKIAGIVVSAVAIGSIAALRVAVAQKQEAMKPCLDTLQTVAGKSITVAEIAATRDDSNQTDYVVFSVGVVHKPGYWESLVSVNSGVCRILNGDRVDSDHPLSEFVSPVIAEKLATLIMVKKIKQAGGKKQFETALTKIASTSKKPLLMPEENYKSLVKIGVKIPANIKPIKGVPNQKQLEEDRH